MFGSGYVRGFFPSATWALLGVMLVAGQKNALPFLLAPTAIDGYQQTTFRGLVLDRSTSAPVANAVVTGSNGRSYRTNRSGQYMVSFIYPDRASAFSLTASGQGFSSSTLSGDFINPPVEPSFVLRPLSRWAPTGQDSLQREPQVGSAARIFNQSWSILSATWADDRLVLLNGGSERFRLLTVLDVSHPDTPTPLGELFLDKPRTMASDGDFAYVVLDKTRPNLALIDLRNPEEPVEALRYDIEAVDLALSGNRLAVKADEKMAGLDISDPFHPVTGAWVHVWEGRLLGMIGGVVVIHRTVSGGQYTPLWDVSDIHNPHIAPSMADMIQNMNQYPFFVSPPLYCFQDYKAIPQWESRTLMYDLLDPAHPAPVGFPAERADRNTVHSQGYLFSENENSGSVSVMTRTADFGSGFEYAEDVLTSESGDLLAASGSRFVRIGGDQEPHSISLYKYIPTRPLDMDHDMAPDGCESDDPLLLAADKTWTHRHLPDSDGDGLLDGQERPNHCEPSTTTLSLSDPRKTDSDDDGFGDGVEVWILGTDPLDPTDPGAMKDGDGDGLPASVDGDDTSPDRDADGFSDSYETLLGADPDDGASHPPLGDTSNDGAADNIDAIMIFNFSLKNARTLQRPDRSDINADGVINNLDAVILFNWTLGNLPILR